MPLSTKVRTRKGQIVVALPAAVARHLVIAPGTLVYWGMPRVHQAMLSVKPTATGGTERRAPACASCDGNRKLVEKLRAQLQQQPAKLVASALNQVRLQWLSQNEVGPGWALSVERQLTRISQQLSELPGARVRRARRATSPPSPAAPPAPPTSEG